MQFNPKFLTTLAIIFVILITGIFVNAITGLQKRVQNLEMRPVAVMPTKEVATPSATMTAAPTKVPFKIAPIK